MTNITGTNMNLTTQVEEYANHMATNELAMVALEKTTSQLQGGIKTLKSNMAGQITKRPVVK